MATAGLLALLDDITTVLDDVAVMTKIAGKKTAAVIGDDLALNANQLSGMSASRELPIVWAVAKGSLINKAILIPALLVITAFLPWLISPLLMIGGAYLCYEGAEKIFHKFLDSHSEKTAIEVEGSVDPVRKEKEKIRAAVFTDLILSAEILVIALGTSIGASLLVQSVSLVAIGLGMTVLVYGTVAVIVKADDFGIRLQEDGGLEFKSRFKRRIGRLIVNGAPKLMKLLSILGTVAMFLVGGEIVSHGISPVEHFIHDLSEFAGAQVPFIEGTLSWIASIFLAILWGMALGVVIAIFKTAVLRILKS